MQSVLVVGAGFAGTVVARQLAEKGIAVDIIDKRPHIGGNAYDELNRFGERIHAYGPHLLHGDENSVAIKWLSRFTEWTPYEHRVRALLASGHTTPLPVNRTTLEDVFGVHLDDEQSARDFLDQLVHSIKPSNTDEVFLANVGEALADLFFRPYTKKMWGVNAFELESSIGARLPVRYSRDDRYFTDTFQAMPRDGYSEMFYRILSHRLIASRLKTAWDPQMLNHYDHVFLSSPIDEFFNYKLGRLPYRSIKFVDKVVSDTQPATVVNFTDDGIYTRSTQWDMIANSGTRNDGLHTITLEAPCDATENNNECFYPVRNQKSIALYKRYCELAELHENITFIGRTGLFKYLDMVPCVNIHLQVANSFLRKASATTSI